VTGNAAQVVAFLMEADRNALWDIKEHKERRTMSQNAYYWQLCTKVAEKLRITTACLHNRMLRLHPRPYLLNDRTVLIPIPDTDEAEEAALESTTFHVRPGSQVITGKDGQRMRTYVLLRGSSDYDTKEMSVLVDDLIEEAKTQGIETLTPAELERIREYERQAEDRKKRKAQRG